MVIWIMGENSRNHWPIDTPDWECVLIYKPMIHTKSGTKDITLDINQPAPGGNVSS